MKAICTALAAALLVVLPVAAADSSPFTPPAAPRCTAPFVWDPLLRACEPQGLLSPIARECTVTLVFDPTDPAQLRLAITPATECSDRDLEYALDAARARLRWMNDR
jgi:hypothetical protein